MFTLDTVLLQVEGKTQEAVVRTIVQHAHGLGNVKDIDKTVRAVLAREEEGTTGFGNGIAIPHGKTDAIMEPIVIFATLQTPNEWCAMDGNPVNMLFMILVPETSAAEHLQILAKLARKLMHVEFTEGLRSKTQKMEIVEFLEAQLN